MLARHVSELIGPSSGAFCTSCIRRLWYVVIRVLLDTSSRSKAVSLVIHNRSVRPTPLSVRIHVRSSKKTTLKMEARWIFETGNYLPINTKPYTRRLDSLSRQLPTIQLLRGRFVYIFVWMNAMKIDYLNVVRIYIFFCKVYHRVPDYVCGVRWVRIPSFMELFVFTYYAVFNSFPLPVTRFVNF